MLNKFLKNLTDITYPTIDQIKNEKWDVEGRFHGSNQMFKFDVRPVDVKDNKLEKIGYLKTKADKIVFETEREWVVFDALEIHKYIETYNLKDILLEDLLKNTDWNIILPKK
jgi:hypothetical protein